MNVSVFKNSAAASARGSCELLGDADRQAESAAAAPALTAGSAQPQDAAAALTAARPLPSSKMPKRIEARGLEPYHELRYHAERYGSMHGCFAQDSCTNHKVC